MFYGETMFVRLFMVAAVCLGFFIHLLLDEIYSVEWDGRPHLKKSFGTAMKFVGENWWANATCYGKLAVLTYFVLIDPSVVQQIYTGQGQQMAQNLGDTMKNGLDSVSATLRAKTRANFGSPASGPQTVSADRIFPRFRHTVNRRHNAGNQCIDGFSAVACLAFVRHGGAAAPAAPAATSWSVPANPPSNRPSQPSSGPSFWQ